MSSNKKNPKLWFMRAQAEQEIPHLYRELPEPTPGMKKWKFGWSILRPLKWGMLTTMVLLVIGEALSLVTLYLSKVLIDLISVIPVEVSLTQLILLCGLLIGVNIVQHAMFRSSGWVSAGIMPLFMQRIELALFRYTTKHSPGYYAKHFAGALANKVRNVSGGYYDLLETFQYQLLDGAILLIGTMLLLGSVHIVLIGVLLVWVVLFLSIYLTVGTRKRAYSKQISARMSTQTGHIVDAFTNNLALTLFAKRAKEADALQEVMYKTFDTKRASWRFNEAMLVGINIVSAVARFALLALAVVFWYQGQATVGDVVLVYGLMDRMNHVLRTIGNVLNRVYGALGSIDEGLETLLVPHEITDEEHAGEAVVTTGEVVFEHISFAYPDRTVLFDDFSLTIKPGEKVGLVGRSGAGKTSLMSLLLRFYDLQEGSIRIDGQDIRAVTQESLREHIAMVPQEPLLFHRTIMENIRYGRAEATDEEVYEAARKALAHEFVMQLPEGYDTKVGERGVKLSGGQRQRIIIARAMLKHAPILVLDEATSSLDSESEEAIAQGLHNLVQGRTVLAIAHRLSTLREMTRLVVMDKGRIVEDGTHEELLAKGGVYAMLWKTQAGGFIQE